MDPAPLLADPEAIRLEKIIQHPGSLTLVVTATRTQADLPWHGVSVRLELLTRRFRCRNSLCTKRVFCERLPRVVAHYGRRTCRMEQALRLVGFLLGGEAGARAALKLAMRTSADTLLRRIRAAVAPCAPTPRVLGVDDFAFRCLRSRTLAAPVSVAAAENDAHVGCRLRLAPHLGKVKRVRRRKASPRLRVPSAREASWLLLRPDDLTDEERPVVELLRRLSPEVGLALSFIEVIKERRVDALRGWLIEAGRSGVAEFRSFANGVTTDLQAVRAALTYDWS